MKVIHLTTVDLSLRYLVFPQLEAVAARGGDAIGISAPGPWVDELEGAGVRHLSLPSSTRGVSLVADVKAAGELWRHLRRERPDVLHTHNPKPGIYGRILARLAGVPIVVNTVHGLYAAPDDPVVKRVLVYLLEAVAARFSHAELVQSSEDLELIRRLRLAPSGHARLLGNGVDLVRFDPGRWTTDHRRRVRRDLGVDDGQVVVGVVGRLVAEKGYPEFLEAVASLDEKYRAVVIGPDDPDKADALDSGLIERARAGGASFLGMRTDVDALYAAMDIFVLPSHREGFPRAAMEAAASGLPVIATDIRGCREVVDHGVNGLLVPVADPDALAAAIRRLGDDEAGRLAMGEAGRRKATRSFDEQRVVEIVLDTYRQVARAQGREALVAELGPPPPAVIRPAGPDDAPHLARLHATSISGGFLSSLGRRFLTVLYRAMIEWAEARVLVADTGGDVVGFVAGVTDTARFYRHFSRHHAPAAALAALPTLVRPATVRRLWETSRYPADGGHGAELLAMAIDQTMRGQGIGRRLGDLFLARMGEAGAEKVTVVVGSDNRTAQAAYAAMGFAAHSTVEVHAGERSEVMVWAPQP